MRQTIEERTRDRLNVILQRIPEIPCGAKSELASDSGPSLQVVYHHKPGVACMRATVTGRAKPPAPDSVLNDTEGNDYVVYETITDYARKGEHQLLCALVPVYNREVEFAHQDDAEDRAHADPRLKQVKNMLRTAIKSTDAGHYCDVYREDATNELKIGGAVSTGFQTAPRQDGCTLLMRCYDHSRNALHNGRALHEMATAALMTLYDYEDDEREAIPAV